MFAAPRRLLTSVYTRGLQPRLAMSSRASSRLKQISKHLDTKPFLELNTPFSTERSARPDDDSGSRPARKKPEEPKKVVVEVTKTTKIVPEPEPEPEAKKKMSTQASHPALLIPGPIEFDDAVLTSMSHHRYELVH